jgi:hypothetical protein
MDIAHPQKKISSQVPKLKEVLILLILEAIVI